MLHKDLVGTDLHVSKIHADTHEAAGTDPLVLAESQVTALVTDLAGKAPTVHVHVKADITDFPTLGSGTVTAVTGTSPVVSSEGATPAISIPAATNAAPGYATAAQITALEAATAAQHAAATIGTGNGLSIAGQAISLAAATASVPGAATAAQITKLDGIAAGATANVGTVTGVTATAPVTSSGGAAPVIALPAATASVDGYATKEQITKLDGIAAGANNYVHPTTNGNVHVPATGAANQIIQYASAGTGKWITLSSDISIADNGAATIPVEAITYAKMQHVSATDKVLGRATAGAGDVEEIACTPFARTVLDDANAAAVLATLGAAEASAITNVDNTSDATKNAAAATLTNKRFTRRVDARATTDTITPEISTYDIFVRTAQAHALVINNHSSSTPVDGDMMLFEILSDATIRAITYGNKYVAKAGVALPAATVASKNLTLLFIWRVDLTQWVLLSAGQEA